ncbi:Biotin carboxyl carrier protein of acetyl-CoA carboxylase [Roseivivax jejudonensis]|uniref:Biotin carboxyl carrier protein of acetyl-CoA carboxylase n=1 Tax=Roseivivax jejudonensis TaxID=1529041 RepID=A0A1X6ZZR8_9RHOB|nr:acetyl-CoA carboxylase biotin carboxyl carrier protein [Roseivivax jejudonensis]SLN66112.1 Biotin carboxyl carrier protein of acetyl-CoA carboxylase [Roseivivax jejudonensis]
MTLSHDEIRQILAIVEGSAFDSIEIRMGDVSIAASKSAPLRPIAAEPAAPAPAQPGPTPAPPAPAPAPAAAEAPAPPAAPAGGTDGLVEVKAPIVGTFYVAPEPGAPPFVRAGDAVDDETTVGIIEVMKVFNNVRAECRGTVERCLVEDGAFVEFGQPILLVRPEA